MLPSKLEMFEESVSNSLLESKSLNKTVVGSKTVLMFVVVINCSCSCSSSDSLFKLVKITN